MFGEDATTGEIPSLFNFELLTLMKNNTQIQLSIIYLREFNLCVRLLAIVFKLCFLIKSCMCSHSFPEFIYLFSSVTIFAKYEGWNFNSGNYLFTTDTQ